MFHYEGYPHVSNELYFGVTTGMQAASAMN